MILNCATDYTAFRLKDEKKNSLQFPSFSKDINSATNLASNLRVCFFTMWDALRNFLPFVLFCVKHTHGEVLLLVNLMGMFNDFKLCKWYQIVKSITYKFFTCSLTHSWSKFPFRPPENTRKPYKWEHWTSYESLTSAINTE